MLMPALRTSIEHRRTFVRTTHLHLPKLHLRMMALRAFLVDDLLGGSDLLRNFERGEVVALTLQSGRVVSWAGGRG